MTTLATLAARAAAAADWSEMLDAGLYAAYARNPAMIPGSTVSDGLGQLALDGSLAAQTERLQFSLTPRLALTRYLDETNLDIDSGSIDLNLIEKFERGQWTLSGEGLTDSTVTSELGLTGITDVNRRHTAGTITTGYQFQQTERLSWQLQGAWQTTRYTDAAHFGLTDYEYLSAQFGPSWNLTELITGSLMLGADRIKPDAGPQQKDYSASLQLKRSFSEQYSWRVTAGETRVESGSGSQGDGNSLLVDIGATRQGERVSWDAELRRSVAPIGLGLLAQEDYVALSAAISTTERGTLNLAFNLIRTKPVTYFGYVIYSGASWGQISAEWQHHLSSHWILSIGYLQARARNNDSVWANGGQARLGILWQSGRL